MVIETPKVAIMGFGGIGVAVGYLLGRQRVSYGVIPHKGLAAGLSVAIQHDGVSTSLRPKVLTPGETVERLFVSVRAYDLQEALQMAQAWLLPGATVTVIVNGACLETAEKWANQMNIQLEYGICTFGVTLVKEMQYALFLSGNTGIKVGSLRGKAEAWAKARVFYNGTPHIDWVDDIKPVYFVKWIQNTVINSLCAVLGLAKNGELLHHGVRLDETFAEAWQLACLLWPDVVVDKVEVYEKVRQLIVDTSENENTMVRDIRLGRRTETDFMAGMARAYPSQFPALEKLQETIRDLSCV